MVFAEAAWLRPFGWGSPVSKESSPNHKGLKAGSWAAFDAADAMERGLLGPPTNPEEDRLVKAPSQEQHVRVRCTKDGAEHRLMDEVGEVMLIARESREDDQRIDIFLASEGTEGVASYTMTFDEDRTQFRLCRMDKNDYCETTGAFKGRELLRVVQTRETIGKGVCMYLDVTVHDIDAGATVQLGSKRPVWNKKLKSLTLDFGGRCDQASPRNFQLCPLDDENESLMFFGKISRNFYNLDYIEPLGALHAFAVAITTKHWEA